MSTDGPRTLLHDAAAGPVAQLDHDDLRRRARGRTRSKWAAAGVAVLAAVVGVGGLIANLQAPPVVDVVDTPGGTVAPAAALPGLPEFPVTLDLPARGEVAAVHVGERPVFVVHLEGGEVLVIDAISPHSSTELPKVVAFCRDPWTFLTPDGEDVVETPGTFGDLWHGSLFALDGAWLGGPAPTGLPRYPVLSTTNGTVEIGAPTAAPDRAVGPFEDRLGPEVHDARPGDSTPGCTTVFDQSRSDSPAGDPTELVWHEPQHADRWLYPFNADGDQAPAPATVDPLVEGERTTSQQQPQGARPIDAILIILAFVAAIAAIGVYMRRREADGSLDAGPSSVSRAGLRRFFDFGPGGWSEDGRNQPPKD
jgi:hypothetical protein